MAGEVGNAPSGTVTFLFSDIVGSTRLWAANRVAMSASLRLHDLLIREILASRGGHVFAHAGDSFGATFGRASSAVTCSLEILDALEQIDWANGPRLEVRLGLHLGEAEEREGNYFGPAVNLAARIMSVAHGGQCVLSDGVRDSTEGFTTDLGVHLLRDIEALIHLSQLGERAFPPLWSSGAGKASLPSPRTSLVGREASVEEVRRRLAENRLVTITGVGGCGKTRVAIEVAHQEVPSHPDGVWFIDLAKISNEEALVGAFVSTLELGVAPGSDPVVQMSTYLAPRHALLIVDNCEHLIDSVATLLDTLLERCEHLRIVATSRESLAIDGEFNWRIPSLATDGNAPAATLFLERCAAAGAILDRSTSTLTDVDEIVRRLDGIPLAIELAAARMSGMDLQQLREGLDDRFRLLSGGPRRSRQRQATLEGAVQWSYDLLTDQERSLLCALAVFQGGFEVDDVAPVAGIDIRRATDIVDQLTLKSLVDVARDEFGHVRHRLLETIRLFALLRLIDSGLAGAVRDRHTDQFYGTDDELSLEKHLTRANFTRSVREYENYQTAAVWALERGYTDKVARLAALMADAGAQRGEIGQLLTWMRLPATLDPTDDIAIQCEVAFSSLVVGDPDGAEVASTRALSLIAENPCDVAVIALINEGLRHANLGDLPSGEEYISRANELAIASYGPVTRDYASQAVIAFEIVAFRFDEAISRASEVLRSPSQFAHLGITEAYLAFAQLALGETDDAQRTVRDFSPSPPGSPWTWGSVEVRHLVLAHVESPEAAATLYSPIARETVARRPYLAADVLQVYAYFRQFVGEEERAQEIVENSFPFVSGHLHNLVALRPRGATATTYYGILERYLKDHPRSVTRALSAQHASRLLSEEFEHWS